MRQKVFRYQEVISDSKLLRLIISTEFWLGLTTLHLSRLRKVLVNPIPYCLFILAALLVSCVKDKPQETVVDDAFADVIFYVRKASNCGLITVNLDTFASKSISDQDYSSTTPSCGGEGATFRNVREGTYNYSAVCDNNEVSGSFTVTQDGCIPIFLDILSDDPSGNDEGSGSGSPSNQGTAAFWISEDLGCGPIDVRVSQGNNQAFGAPRTITSFFSQAPNCGAEGSATFGALSIYNTIYYTASCNGKEWSGVFTVTGGECKRIELTDNDTSGGTTGDVKFWISEDFGCGNITVNISGEGSSVITGYFNNEPACENANSGGNFDGLDIGNYSFTASCSGGLTWSGDITITADNCLTVKLTN